MKNQFTWRDFLTFDKMLAPTFLSAVYLVLYPVSKAGYSAYLL